MGFGAAMLWGSRSFRALYSFFAAIVDCWCQFGVYVYCCV